MRPGRSPVEEAPLPDEQSWARRVRGGEVAALEEAFRAYYARLCSFVRHQVGSAETAEEIVQDVFLRVWEHRTRLDPTGSLRALLYRAARNAALNHIKHREIERRWQAQVQSAPPPLAEGAEAQAREHELASAIERAVASLPERCRLVFLLSREQGLSYAEIAQTLAISIKTVETQMGRALKALRASLSNFLLLL